MQARMLLSFSLSPSSGRHSSQEACVDQGTFPPLSQWFRSTPTRQGACVAVCTAAVTAPSVHHTCSHTKHSSETSELALTHLLHLLHPTAIAEFNTPLLRDKRLAHPSGRTLSACRKRSMSPLACAAATFICRPRPLAVRITCSTEDRGRSSLLRLSPYCGHATLRQVPSSATPWPLAFSPPLLSHLGYLRRLQRAQT